MLRPRAFGTDTADIEIDFAGTDRASAVTAVLAACLADEQGQAPDGEQLWDWTLNARLQGLIAVQLASGDAAIELRADCAHCGEAMALELDLRALAAEPVAPRFTFRDGQGAELALRLPRGRDLQRWLKEGVHAQEALAAALVDAVDGRPVEAADGRGTEWLAALDDAFAAHDPLTSLQLQASCPACGHGNSVACELEAVLLGGFARAQSSLLDEVLRLASALHWSERQILALPAWRRAYYLRRLEGRGLA